MKKHPNKTRSLYLGMRPGDLDGKSYGHFFQPRMAPLSDRVIQAYVQSPVASLLLPDLKTYTSEPDAGGLDRGLLQDGFGFFDDGTLHVAIRTPMKGVVPKMLDFWFGWHGCEAQRYKLWHPSAHVHAQWDGPEPSRNEGVDRLEIAWLRSRYLGRTSFVDEFLGSTMAHAAIRFLHPSELGFVVPLLDPEEKTIICARISFADQPLGLGYLIHTVRRTEEGSEMDSRFWIGGQYASLSLGQGDQSQGSMEQMASRLLRRLRRPSREEGRDLLVHCAQEMAHLAKFLPTLYRAYGEGLIED